MKKQLKITLLLCAFAFTCIISNKADAKNDKQIYLVYSNENSNNELLEGTEGEGLIDDTLNKENIATTYLSKSEKEKLEQEGYTVEKDVTLTASNISSKKAKCGIKQYEQWNLEAIHSKDVSQTNKKTKIAILDSGVSDTTDISIIKRECFVPNEEAISPLWEDGTGHGTAIAGIIGAKKNDEGITGILEGYPIYSLRVLDDNNTTTISSVVAAIYWAIDNDINVLNMSFGTSVNSKLLHKAIKDADNAGMLIVAASGNSDTTSLQYPAAYPEVLAVGASDNKGCISDITSRATKFDIVAPGESIISTGLLNGLVGVSGTSISTAQVSAAATKIWNVDPKKSNDFIKKLLIFSSRQLRDSDKNDIGLLDIESALNNYKAFETSYSKPKHIKQKLNNAIAEKFDDEKTVSALWTQNQHESIITGYINPNVDISASNLKIMIHTARGADNATYHKTSCLHGTGNYIKGLKYLYFVAQYVRQGESNKSASQLAYKKIPSGGNDMIDALKLQTEKMLANSDSNSNSTRYYRVMGFALHCIGDTFAHRAYIYELDGFKSEDFSNFSQFKKAVKNQLEYRYIKRYTDVSLSTYEDNPKIGSRRFKNAGLKSLQFFKAAKNKNGYSSRFYENLEYSLTLDGLANYKKSY